MRLKFTMSRFESGMLPIYERILAIPNERARARYIRSLLIAITVHPQQSLPDWFSELPRKPFSSQRAVSIRMFIDEDEPVLRSLVKELEVLEHAERVCRIKEMLLGICTVTSPTTPAMATTAVKSDQSKAEPTSIPDSANPAVSAPSIAPGDSAPAETLAVQTDAADEMRQRFRKSFLAMNNLL